MSKENKDKSVIGNLSKKSGGFIEDPGRARCDDRPQGTLCCSHCPNLIMFYEPEPGYRIPIMKCSKGRTPHY